MTSLQASDVLPELVAGGWAAPRYSTGLSQLDERLGGVAAGELWVVTGAPGQGRSMLLTQCAGRFAGGHGLLTWVASNRDPAEVVFARLSSAAARVPFNHLTDDRVTDEDRARLEDASASLTSAPLRVVDGVGAADRLADELTQRSPAMPTAVVLDDPDWPSGWDLRRARAVADRGAAVVVSLPRSRVLDGPAYRCDLHPEAALADVVVEVRHTNLALAEVAPFQDEPGYAALAVLRNRRGPVGTALVAFQGHYARFTDLRPPEAPPDQRGI